MRLKIRSSHLALIAVASFTALTCDDAPPVVPLALQVAQAFCAHQFACCSPIEMSAVTYDRYTTESDCVGFAALAARRQLAAVDSSVAQGRITIDAVTAEACVKAYRDRACNKSLQMPEAVGAVPDVADVLGFCPDLLVGHVRDGSTCFLSQECAPGSRCAGGTPQPPIGPAFEGDPSSPSPGLCVRYQKAGEPCNDSADCDPLHACQTPAFVCGERLQEGAPCFPQFDPVTNQLRDDCDSARNLYCDQFGTFICRHYPREGERCNQFGLPQCDPDPELALWCSPFAGVCKRPGNEGAACGAPAIPPCRYDLGCHPLQPDGIGECGALPALGETCSDRCVSPAVCSSGFCSLPGALRIGAPCSAESECASFTCAGFESGTRTCSPPQISTTCVGSGITVGAVTGIGGAGGGGGSGGTMVVGSGGSFVTGGGGTGRAGAPGPAGAGGAGGGVGGGGGGVFIGCQVSDVPADDPVIADFEMMEVVPIGGTFTYPTPGGPAAMISNGAVHITANTLGMATPQYWGVGIYFNGNPAGTDCVDATGHIGVQFDVSGTIAGEGCSAQYSTNDSEHTDRSLDPKGSGPAGAYPPQAPFMTTATVTTVKMPFAGPGAPMGGSPAIPVDRAKLTGVQWQFTTAGGSTNSCNVDITIDNVRFF